MQEWQDFRFHSNDGLLLAGRKYGWEHTDRLPVLCLPGLTRNSADFHEFALHLTQNSNRPRRVLCLDYRGRGNSQYDSNWENYNPLVETTDVIDALTVLGLHQVAIVGTSRGGLISMVLAAMRPGLMKTVVLNDIGPEIDGPGLVRIKNYVEKAQEPRNWIEAAQILQAYGAKQFPRLSLEDWEHQAQLIFKQENGKLVRQYDVGMTTALKSINLDAPLPTFWPQFAGLNHLPVMLLRGENSDLLSLQTVEKMKNIHPNLSFVSVPDQGHAPDLGAVEIARKIERFIKLTDAA